MAPKNKKSNGGLALGIILVIVAVSVAGFFIYKSQSAKPFTALESTFFQLFILATSLVGSFYVTKRFSEKSALKALKPYARSSFRRMLSLYSGLIRLNGSFAKEIHGTKDGVPLEKLKDILNEQIYTAIDALEEWRDIIPEDVEEIELRSKNTDFKRQGTSDDKQ